MNRVEIQRIKGRKELFFFFLLISISLMNVFTHNVEKKIIWLKYVFAVIFLNISFWRHILVNVFHVVRLTEGKVNR